MTGNCSSMSERYTPYVFAVAHDRRLANDVLDTIAHIGVKSVGMEYSEVAYREKLNNPPYDFFTDVASRLEKRGVKVVFLESPQLTKRLRRVISNNRPDEIFGFGIHGHDQALIKDTVTRKLEETAKRERPEMLLVSAIHGFVLKSDLKIPKDRFFVRLVDSERTKVALRHVVDIRRFRRKRNALKRKNRI